MKKIFVLIVALVAGVLVYSQKFNDPNAQLRDLKGFHGINVSSAFNVYLNQGDEEAVAVSAASEKDREKIKTEVKNGILYVGVDHRGWNSSNKNLKVYISVKDIDKLTVSGACDVYVAGVIKADVLSISQSGASDFKEGKLEVNILSIDLSGASDMNVTGRAGMVTIEASGASSFKGFDLFAEICNLKASGASDIKITVNKELSAEASGASDIHYKGEGVIRDIRSSGSGSVRKV